MPEERLRVAMMRQQAAFDSVDPRVYQAPFRSTGEIEEVVVRERPFPQPTFFVPRRLSGPCAAFRVQDEPTDTSHLVDCIH
jgi:hypothetical protein